jgi:hypothetical protein
MYKDSLKKNRLIKAYKIINFPDGNRENNKDFLFIVLLTNIINEE